MKIVINSCYGGFSLSPQGLKEYARLNGRECYFFKGGLGSTRQAIDMPKKGDMFWDAFTTSDIDEINKISNSNGWASMTKEQKDKFNDEYEKINLRHYEISRTDKNLINVVESMGSDASGACASLRVVEIPDGINYEIDEYDGNETIRESHRTWG
jgi:hypothetical protein